jgi:AraC-like DNA-binding protein
MKRKDVQLILQIRDYIEEHLYESHSIDGLCRQFNINREKLQVGFREQVGTTVHAFIIKLRMARAAQRLIDSDDSIKVIALDSGYKKQRSFNKTFKTIFQLTPAAYRKMHQP